MAGESIQTRIYSNNAVRIISCIVGLSVAVFVPLGVLNAYWRPSAVEHLRQRGFASVDFKASYLPCGPGPIWSGNLFLVGWEFSAHLERPNREDYLLVGRLCRGFSNLTWRLFELDHYCFDSRIKGWIQIPEKPEAGCPVRPTGR